MRVLTLNDADFGRHCRMLADKVMASGIKADAIVGIATGGVYVGKEMAAEMGCPMFVMSLQRPTTATKQRLFPKLLSRMPRWLNDLLRMGESFLLSVSGRFTHSGHRVVPVDVPADLERFMSGHRDVSILVADDAVDSGRTLRSVVGELRSRFPEADVRSAVITVTTRQSTDIVDVCLYDNGTLIRFPWSIDA